MNTTKNIGEVKMKDEKKYSDSSMKVDKTCHKNNQDMGTMAKKTTMPGQMYVPKRTSNESDFVGEHK